MAKAATSTAELVVEDQAPLFSDTTKICLFGRYGSKKTFAIASLIDLVGQDNVLIVSAEHGLNTIKSKIKDSQVVTTASLPELRSAFPGIKDWANRDGDKSDRWIVVDGMSQVTEWIANEQLSGADRYYDAMKQGRDPNPNDLPFGRFIQRGEINGMACYARIGRDSENLLASFITLPCNLYCNYLEDMTGTSGFEKTVPFGPDVPGRVGLKAVMSSFDYVGRLYYNEKGELVAGFDSTSRLYMARTREDRTLVQIPKEIVNFDLGAFIRLVRGEKSEVAGA